MTGIIENALGIALTEPVKRKANKTKKLRIVAKRVTEGYSEVMIKITGFGKGAGHVKSHLDYITRNGGVEMENDRGEIFSGKEEVKELFKDWEKDFADGKRHKNQRDTMHMVLSMPEGTDPESVRQAVREFAKSNFSKNHEYVFVLHTDEPHPHCHLTVKCLGFDGKRLNPRKADLQHWREVFAEKMRDQGVNAEATARRSRGVVKKPEPNIIRHIEKGDKTHKPRVPKVKALKIKEVAEEMAAEAQGLQPLPKPWEEAIKARQNEIRRAWLAAAAELETENKRITFNSKEVKNDRPQYDLLSDRTARQIHRAAAVYQSRLEKSRPQAPPGTITSVRNLSSLGVVHDRSSAQVLLQQDAPDRLERRSGTSLEVRRPGVGPNRASAGSERLAQGEVSPHENKALAERIRRFVAAMPGIDTERQQIKRELVHKFTLDAQQAQGKNLGAEPEGKTQRQENDAGKIGRNARKGDVER